MTFKKVTPITAQPTPLTLEGMPAMMQMMYQDIITLREDFKALRMQQPVNEPPIDGKEMLIRLDISEPTLGRMRVRGEIPFLEVGGNFRYLWPDVLLALASKKKGKKIITQKAIVNLEINNDLKLKHK